ncbi:DUF1045 domain-containing protein [Yoonia sp.]|jgi:putative phosphonate metabolism protein|uniref:DUF1045 domain-containing protein n=1 Tax=Yoonia sp. TaxID=2212373 RepID=UPI0025D6E1C9|nr:DUF1045 domain-containing protein [Yoonia sp.]
MFIRYAVFYTPPAGAFADFCAAWLGWDSHQSRRVDHPAVGDLDVAALTDVPRQYGFHATLKAPFGLHSGTTADGLSAAITRLAARTAPVTVQQMTLQQHHGFMAIRPVGDVPALRALAACIVRDLDPFRAPAKPSDIAKRRRRGLTPQQDLNLIQWGYPYVMDDFAFHMTLTGRVDDATAQSVADQLTPVLTPLIPQPFVIDHLTLLGQDTAGLFHEIHRYALAG